MNGGKRNCFLLTVFYPRVEKRCYKKMNNQRDLKMRGTKKHRRFNDGKARKIKTSGFRWGLSKRWCKGQYLVTGDGEVELVRLDALEIISFRSRRRRYLHPSLCCRKWEGSFNHSVEFVRNSVEHWEKEVSRKCCRRFHVHE